MEDVRCNCMTLRTDDRKRSRGVENVGRALGCVGDLTLTLGVVLVEGLRDEGRFGAVASIDFGGSDGGVECAGERGGGPSSSSSRSGVNERPSESLKLFSRAIVSKSKFWSKFWRPGLQVLIYRLA